MPEGDTLFRTAHTLRKALLDRFITGVECQVDQVTRRLAEVSVINRQITAVEARGKHLLIVFRGDRPAPDVRNALHLALAENDLVLHSHLELIGSWHVYRPGERWRKPARLARITLFTDEFVTPCFNAPTVELLSARETARSRTLVSLGPDAATDEFDRAEALKRLRDRPHLPIAVALMNQNAMAGVGNVFKSEVLFICRVSPFDLVSQLPAAVLEQLVAESHRLLVVNRRSGPRKTTDGLSKEDLLWVYGRNRQSCRVCGSKIRLCRQGFDARSTYYCPHCQGVSAEGSPSVRIA